jgi:sodium/bile acid cotransporter 7
VSLDSVGLVFSELLVPFIAGHLLRPWIGGWADNNRRVLSVADRGSILLVVYAAFSAAVEHGVWHQLSPNVLFPLALIVAFVLATILLTIKFASSAMDFGHQDEIAAMFCGSQKSLVGPILIPIMLYYPVQIVVCAWLARRYAATSDAVTGLVVRTHRGVASVGNGGPPKSCKPRTGEIPQVFGMGFTTLGQAGQRLSRPSATQHHVER